MLWSCSMRRFLARTAEALACSFLLVLPAVAAQPVPLSSLQEIEAPAGLSEELSGLQIRNDAIREAALSYGARGGLSARTFELMLEVAKYDTEMSRVFDFRQLLVPAPSGMLIEPPVIDESQYALKVAPEGQEAAVADRVFAIDKPARIVSAPRDWRSYIEREWDMVEPPVAVLLPRTDEERASWRKWVSEGWKMGFQQADEIFQADLDRLVKDYTGMVRYRMLLAQGMVSAPYAMHQDRGVTGGGKEMRVGDRAIRITGPSQFEPRAERWTPADR
ncbi:MAG: hypothetical protein A2018_08000 [Alphaproteobacteria bacterium GWF2_58_20]|nr:MAG: hypothetical protein A2018_08000 [Alphaproteobacteria bacterium GWF2_58_20]